MDTRVHVVGQFYAGVDIGSCATYLFDLYHVCDYLAAVWLEDKATVHAHRDAFKEGRLDEILLALRNRLEPQTCLEEHAPARRVLRYLENRLHQLDYAAAGLPVGSGLIESSHRDLLRARLKLSGACWIEQNAHHMTQLRVCRANAQWDAYWRNCHSFQLRPSLGGSHLPACLYRGHGPKTHEPHLHGLNFPRK